MSQAHSASKTLSCGKPKDPPYSCLPPIVSGSIPSRANILGPVDEGNTPRQNPVLQAAIAKYAMLPETFVFSVSSAAIIYSN